MQSSGMTTSARVCWRYFLFVHISTQGTQDQSSEQKIEYIVEFVYHTMLLHIQEDLHGLLAIYGNTYKAYYFVGLSRISFATLSSIA